MSHSSFSNYRHRRADVIMECDDCEHVYFQAFDSVRFPLATVDMLLMVRQ